MSSYTKVTAQTISDSYKKANFGFIKTVKNSFCLKTVATDLSAAYCVAPKLLSTPFSTPAKNVERDEVLEDGLVHGTKSIRLKITAKTYLCAWADLLHQVKNKCFKGEVYKEYELYSLKY